MKATIVHESRGRMRLRLRQKTMTFRQADLLETWLKAYLLRHCGLCG